MTEKPKDPSLEAERQAKLAFIEAEMKKQAKRELRSLKDQYLELLRKDPSIKFVQAKQKQKPKEDDGISWGMIDEEEIYRHQQEQDYPLEPDLLKKLPNLTANQLEKIKLYDEKNTKFKEVQNELDEILNRERQSFGLEEILKKRKEKLQYKAGEYGNELDQADENLRFSLFGDKPFGNKQNHQRYIESSDDDEYYDHTLANKKKKVKVNEAPPEETDVPEKPVDTYTEMKKQLEYCIAQRNKVQEQLLNLSTQHEQTKKNEDIDELDAYMQATTEQLLQESRPKLLKSIQDLQTEINSLESKLRQAKPEIAQVSIKDIFSAPEVQQPKKEVVPEQPKVGIKSTLKQLKEMRQKQENQGDETEEQALEKARLFFEKEQQRERDAEKKKIQDQKRKERLAMFGNEINKILDQQDEEPVVDKPKKVYGANFKPHSRHYNTKEVENEDDYVDLVQFQ